MIKIFKKSFSKFENKIIIKKKIWSKKKLKKKLKAIAKR